MFPEYHEAATVLCFNLIRLANRIANDLEEVSGPPYPKSQLFRLRTLIAIRAAGTDYPNELEDIERLKRINFEPA